jgi:putative ABC transport system permease protein
MTVVAGEGAAWLAAGTLIGLLLGLAVSVVLVHVVNPQSFHWTMELALPCRPAGGAVPPRCWPPAWPPRLCSARARPSRSAVLAVKEDW